MRVCVARGSMPYSAVTQPCAWPRRNDGTLSSTLAVHSTRVAPNPTSTEPSACLVYPRSKLNVAQLVRRAAARSQAHAARQRSAAALVLSL